MNKIRVIELLNKIANGEEVPKEIKYDTMNYVFRHYDYKEVHGELIDEQSSWLEKIDFYKLDDEVEIIEENKKIEKLCQTLNRLDIGDDYYRYIMENRFKINEIIDYLEENK